MCWVIRIGLGLVFEGRTCEISSNISNDCTIKLGNHACSWIPMPLSSLGATLKHGYTYLLTYLFTYTTEQSTSWEASRFSSSQKNSPHWWNPKVHYRTHTCSPPVPSWARSIQSMPPSNLLKIHLNIILPSTHGSSKWYLSGFPTKNLYTPLLSPYVLPARPSHASRFDHPNDIWWSLSSALCSFLHSSVPLSLLGPNILKHVQPTFLP